ncbi:hypothetical protein NE237_030089 [Protea cynaroides]|uniref:Uncharacterized protein n=1 Tax=Protea cynaroides TaxID=273540 RepID=A0A9Q0GSD7_9MAGN|nr:hypothetical protein NE237_030089 [Protea cynaroides]
MQFPSPLFFKIRCFLSFHVFVISANFLYIYFFSFRNLLYIDGQMSTLIAFFNPVNFSNQSLPQYIPPYNPSYLFSQKKNTKILLFSLKFCQTFVFIERARLLGEQFTDFLC